MLNAKIAKIGLIALVLTMPALSGCSTGPFAPAGSSSAQVADISSYGNPTADEALRQARAHFRERNFGYSAAFYKRYVELTPQDPEGYIGLGASYDRLRRFDLSDRVYASLHRIDGDSVAYFNNLGYSHLLRGNLASAMRNFRQAQSLDPDNMIVNNNIQLITDATSNTA